ncbi:hypothetical protein O181_108792 [Austropuccinia psidii MF-1]|uniref:Uncharacterized protein n=1 Tax=Austropuccinia psidii MF-1 TaxID=1389203 RepID=A0A9Q3PQR9_9BASI|nr:hypothetical protein [Austropuccinia psidii MF-1]
MRTRRWNLLSYLPLATEHHKTDNFAIIDFEVRNVLNKYYWNKLEKNIIVKDKKKEGIWPYLHESPKFKGIDVARPSEPVQRIEKCPQSGQGDAYTKRWVEYPLKGAFQERNLLS